MLYLHHQLSDGADILQSRSTSEYFETVKYELQTSFHVRVTPWIRSKFETLVVVWHCQTELTDARFCRCHQVSANWPPSWRLRSTSVLFWCKIILKYFNKKNTRTSGSASGHLLHKNLIFCNSFHWDSQPPPWIEWNVCRNRSESFKKVFVLLCHKNMSF